MCIRDRYSWVLTIVLCSVYVFGIFMSAYAITYTYVGVVTSVAGAILLLVLCYYRIMDVSFGDRQTLNGIDSLDKKLESLGIKIPHRRNEILCLVFLFVYVFVKAAVVCKNLNYMHLSLIHI